MKYTIDGHRPRIAPGCFIAPNAALIGRVIMHADASVWFGVTIRAEHEDVTIGARSNIQDGAVLHVDPGFALTIGESVTIGHKAMLHGCTIGDGSLVGINAVVLNGAVIGKNCLIGANALITEKMQVPDGALVMGSPGKVLRILDEDGRAALAANALHYVRNGQLYNERLQVVEDDG